MNFSHPELKAYNEELQELLRRGKVDSELGRNEIYLLMAMTDRFRLAEWELGGSLPSPGELDWKPKSPQLVEILNRLMAPERRAALRSWYDTPEMNASAESFRDWLSAAIGEELSSHPARNEPS